MKTRFTALLVGALLTTSSLCAQAQPKANDKTPDASHLLDRVEDRTEQTSLK